jgi:acyl-CoA hydrolase
MNYSQMYQAKLTTPAKLAEVLQSDWTLGMDAGPSQTPAIMSAFAAKVRESDLKGIKVQTLLDVYPYEFYADNSLFGKLTGYSWFSSGGARKAINGGWADFIPAYYRDIPGHIRREYEYDAFCVSVSPMDKHGYFRP